MRPRRLSSSEIYLTDITIIFCRGGADFIFIPERPPAGDIWEDQMCDEIKRVSCPLHFVTFLLIASQHRQVGKRKTIVIVAEGAHDKNLEPIRADYIKIVLSERLGLDTRVTTLGHTQRGGRPCAVDRILVSWLISWRDCGTEIDEAHITRCGRSGSFAGSGAWYTDIYDWDTGK